MPGISSVLPVLFLTIVLAGCANTPHQKSARNSPEARQVTQSAHCGLTGPGVAWVRSAEHRDRLLGVAGQNLSTELVRAVDLADESLVFVTLGQKPTAGYSVTLDGFSAEQGVLSLSMKLREPAPGMATAQVITSPCAVLAIKPVDWQKLKVSGLTPKPLVGLPKPDNR